MRFEKIKIKNIGPFKDAEVDLAAAPGQLVALTGDNGAGKSTLLELLAGSLYRSCPTRGSLSDLATARDAMVELTFVNGQRHTVRQLVDNISGKGEALVLDEAGAPVLTSAKLKEFDAWAARNVTPAEVLYASSFAVQGRRGFLDLKPGERKALLVEVLGLQRLERMADAARERAKAAKAELDTLRGKLGACPLVDVQALAVAAAEARSRVDSAAQGAKAARDAHERAKAAATDAARAAELAEQRKAAEGRLRAAQAGILDAETRIANNRKLLERSAEVAAAVARVAEIDRDLAALRAELAEKVASVRVAAEAKMAADTARTRAIRAQDDARGRIAKARARLKDADAVRAARGQLEDQRERLMALAGDSADLTKACEDLEALVLSGKDQRIDGLRGGLSEIASYEGGEPTEHARRILDGDDKLAEQLASAPERLKAERKRLADKRIEQEDARKRLVDLERLAARATEIDAAEADLRTSQNDEASATDAVQAAEVELNARGYATGQAELERQAVANRVDALDRERSTLAPTAALASKLAEAEARIEERTAQLERERAALAAAEAELAGLPVVDVAAIDLNAYEAGVQRAEADEAAARDRCARAEADVERGREANAKRAAIEAEVAAAEGELSDWTRLAQDLGKDGVQALEMDAALPELNTIANDLLRECVGTRFTVDLRTERLSSDGKRVLEGLDVRVIDVLRGRDDLAETYSGGECVIVGEAVALALTTLACRRLGLERPTILRDESGAALDAANGRAYMSMLRLAARHIDADKVIVVTHDQSLAEMADSRCVIENGKVTVQ